MTYHQYKGALEFRGILLGIFWCSQRSLYHDISLPRYFLDQLGSVGSLVGVFLMVRGVTISPDFDENWLKMVYCSNNTDLK